MNIKAFFQSIGKGLDKFASIEGVRHAGIVACFIILSWIAFQEGKTYAAHRFNNLGNSLKFLYASKPSDPQDPNWQSIINYNQLYRVNLDFSMARSEARLRLFHQLADADLGAYHHIQTAFEFYRQYFACILLSALGYITSACFLFVLTKNGWGQQDGKHSYLMTAFVSTFAIGSLFASFILIYEQPKNIADNCELYRRHIALDSKLRTYIAVNPEHNTLESERFKADSTLAMETAADLADMTQVAIGFDAAKLSDLSKIFQNTK